MDNLVYFGANQVVKSMGAKQGEKVIIICENDNFDVMQIIAKSFQQITSQVLLFNVDSYQRPLTSIPKDIENNIIDANIVLNSVQKNNSEETLKFIRPLKLSVTDHARFSFMPGMNEAMLKTGMGVNYEDVEKFSTKVYNFVKKSKEISVKTKQGTDIQIQIENDSTWKNTYGKYHSIPQEGYNLPSGEVFTWPQKVDGTYVIDGEIADVFLKYKNLERQPLVLTIKDSIITHVQSENKELETEFKEFIKSHENGNKISEIGLGTNIGIKDYIGIMLQDEKIPGIHMAIGNPCTGTMKNPYKSTIHVDMLIRDATVLVDGNLLMKDGIYFI